jgi:hypothetical protein
MYKINYTKNTKTAMMGLVPMLLSAALLMVPIDVHALDEILVTFEHCPSDCGGWPAPGGSGSSFSSDTDGDIADENRDDDRTSDSKVEQAGGRHSESK